MCLEVEPHGAVGGFLRCPRFLWAMGFLTRIPIRVAPYVSHTVRPINNEIQLPQCRDPDAGFKDVLAVSYVHFSPARLTNRHLLPRQWPDGQILRFVRASKGRARTKHE